MPALTKPLTKLLLVVLLLTALFQNAKAQEEYIRETDSLTLVALYNTYNGPNWIDNSGWLKAEVPVCKWSGVKVANGYVVELELWLDSFYEGIVDDMCNFRMLSKLALIDKNGIIELYLFDVGDLNNTINEANDANKLVSNEKKYKEDSHLKSVERSSNVFELNITSDCNIPVFSINNISNCGNVGTIEILGLDITKGYEYYISPRITNNIPTIELIGNSVITIAVGSSFIDPWVHAIDVEDGDISNLVSVTGTVNVNVPGTYILTYNVVDSDGNAAISVNRNVSVVEFPMCLDGSYPSMSVWKEIRLSDGSTIYLSSLSQVKSLIDDIRSGKVKAVGASGYIRKLQNFPPLLGQYTYYFRSPYCRQELYSTTYLIDGYRPTDNVLIVKRGSDGRFDFVEYY